MKAMAVLPLDLDVKLSRLRADLARLGRVVVACSGGVDSCLLAVVAHQANRVSTATTNQLDTVAAKYAAGSRTRAAGHNLAMALTPSPMAGEGWGEGEPQLISTFET